MSAIGKLAISVVLLACATIAPAAEPEQDAPAIYQGAEHFYNAIGTASLRVTWHETPTDGGSFRLSLLIDSVQNPARVRAPELAKNPKFQALFDQIQLESSSDLRESGVTFHYQVRLRDRSTTRVELPSLRFDYYNPNASANRAIQTKYPEVFTLEVASPSKPVVVPTVPLVVPGEYQNLPTDNALSPDRVSMAWFTLVGIVSVVGAVLIRKYQRPRTPAELRKTARRLARRQLARATLAPDPPRAVAQVVQDFAARGWRTELPDVLTATVVEAFATAPPELRTAFVEFAYAYERLRFGPPNSTDVDLVFLAQTLIEVEPETYP